MIGVGMRRMVMMVAIAMTVMVLVVVMMVMIVVVIMILAIVVMMAVRGLLVAVGADALPQPARDVCGGGVGVGVGGGAPGHHEKGLGPRHPPARRRLGLLDALAGDGQQVEVDGEVAAIVDPEPRMLRLIGVEHRGN